MLSRPASWITAGLQKLSILPPSTNCRKYYTSKVPCAFTVRLFRLFICSGYFWVTSDETKGDTACVSDNSVVSHHYFKDCSETKTNGNMNARHIFTFIFIPFLVNSLEIFLFWICLFKIWKSFVKIIFVWYLGLFGRFLNCFIKNHLPETVNFQVENLFLYAIRI